MGLNSCWIAEVSGAILELEISCRIYNQEQFTLLELDEGSLVLNLISKVNPLTPDLLLKERAFLSSKGVLLVQLWEDIWVMKKTQVLSRIRSLLGKNQRLHGRKTNIEILDQRRADEFLLAHHLQGSAKARYKFGLTHDHELVAVATFSGSRLMRFKGPEYRSTELIRFACKSGITVTGGLSKLIKHFVDLLRPNDLMSYADRDWSDGSGYVAAGFTLAEVQEPAYLWLDVTTLSRYFPHRRPEEVPESNFVEIFNTGNLKYILYL